MTCINLDLFSWKEKINTYFLVTSVNEKVRPEASQREPNELNECHFLPYCLL